MWVYLSHFMDETSPAYGGGDGFHRTERNAMSKGDSCNTSQWQFPNHLGTHIDFPFHFDNAGSRLDDFDPGTWIFRTPHLVETADLAPSTPIGAELLNHHSIPPETDMLIVKTGFGDHRDQPRYWQEGPVFLPELADALRASCPDLRVVGIDTISISSWTDRTIGRAAHRAFLAAERPILLLEDMDLSPVTGSTRLHQIIASPLLVHHADGAPCTVLAEVVDR